MSAALPRNQYVPPRAMAILMAMKNAQDYDCELVNEKREWWIGLRRYRQKDCLMLLQLCLLHEENSSEGFYRYTLNEEARKVMADSAYRPLILKELAKR